MAEERQQSQATSGQGQQGQQASGQGTQEVQRRDNGQQTGLARRGSFMPSVFNMDPMEMFRTSPFALMRRMSEEMDQWFEQFGMGRGARGGATAGGAIYAPPVEVFEREGNLIVRADLPGMSKDDIRVEVTDDGLLIEGERRTEHEERQGGMFHSERRYGMFRRQLPLPEGVNAEQATANFKDGVLEISIPAPQRQARGHRIDIQGSTTGNGGQQGGAMGSAGQQGSSTSQAGQQSGARGNAGQQGGSTGNGGQQTPRGTEQHQTETTAEKR